MSISNPPVSSIATTPADADSEANLKNAQKPADFNRIGLDYTQPIARPPVDGLVIDAHTHMLAARHAKLWFEIGKHYGIDAYVSMTPLEEALVVQREWPGRVQFICVPKWAENSIDDWLRRLESFYNLGSRVIKFHMAPGTMQARGWRLDTPGIRRIIDEALSRGMIIMSHVGDPDTWYAGKYADTAKYGTREEHYRIWEETIQYIDGKPWWGAHLGGNPENFGRLTDLMTRYPNLWLDLSATRWMVREVSAHRDEARKFITQFQDRLMWGSDQVSTDDRGADFLASRWWCHRKLWETDYEGVTPILDPDVPEDKQPMLRGLSLPAPILQKLYHDNVIKLLGSVGVHFR